MIALLVVEDAPEIAWIVQRLGRLSGHSVVCCPDVEKAWSALGQHRPDLLLVDLNLPGARGEELCRRVRVDPGLRGLPLALFSHWDRPEDILSGLQAGARFVVSKDLISDPEAWNERIQDCLVDFDLKNLNMDQANAGTRASVSLATATAAVNRALRHPTPRTFAPEILRFLMLRAIRRAGSDPSWLCEEEFQLNVQRLPQGASRTSLVAFASAFATEIWCLLGTRAAASFRDALAAALSCSGS